jgi:hypothetical protein
MKRLYLLILLVFVCVSSSSKAQSGSFADYRPYLGAAFDLYFGTDEGVFGWGFEIGSLWDFGYLGLEAGRCRLRPSSNVAVINADYNFYRNPYEAFYAAHLGVVLAHRIGVGIVVIESFQSYAAFVGHVAESRFNIGPDVHLQLGENSMLATAFTVRRGFKFGLDYLF